MGGNARPRRDADQHDSSTLGDVHVHGHGGVAVVERPAPPARRGGQHEGEQGNKVTSYTAPGDHLEPAGRQHHRLPASVSRMGAAPSITTSSDDGAPAPHHPEIAAGPSQTARTRSTSPPPRTARPVPRPLTWTSRHHPADLSPGARDRLVDVRPERDDSLLQRECRRLVQARGHGDGLGVGAGVGDLPKHRHDRLDTCRRDRDDAIPRPLHVEHGLVDGQSDGPGLLHGTGKDVAGNSASTS